MSQISPSSLQELAEQYRLMTDQTEGSLLYSVHQLRVTQLSSPQQALEQLQELRAQHEKMVQNANDTITKVSLELSTQQSGDINMIQSTFLQKLVQEIDPTLFLDETVIKYLSHEGTAFLESVVRGACDIAQNRGSSLVEVSDLQTVLKLQYGIKITYPMDVNHTEIMIEQLRAQNRSDIIDQTPKHAKRIAAINKTKEYEQSVTVEKPQRRSRRNP
ncbi:hypothetical protein BLNAU_6575 [Blattamonas nauphoetae]|uniref:Transcription initiation factor TFIID subunit 12 domain-containing protein n=1 Tax=Blattamonas nauphoetae TaxID=2049346 RepID=A0ABQ9Y468_9EUKA|nr:hypothetical protein BLNAU_6575 [Blattamonas nauphoetae]